jgi:hypothetical protein
MRPVKLNALADFQIAEEIRKEAILYTIYAQVKDVHTRRRRDGVGACLRFPSVIDRDAGDELTWHEVEMRKLIDGEFEVIALRGFGEQ